MFHQVEQLQKVLEEKERLVKDCAPKETGNDTSTPEGHPSTPEGPSDGSEPSSTDPTPATLRKEIQELKALLTYLDEELMPMKKKSETLFEENKVTFDILWLLFHEGTEVIFQDVRVGLKSAGKVSTTT